MTKTFLTSLLFLSFLVNAQNPVKKSLTHEDYAGWKTIENPKISDSGELTVYETVPQKGDGHLFIYDHKTGTSKIIPRGKKPEIGPADRYVAFTIAQPADTVRKAKIKKVKREDMPKDSLGILLMDRDTVIKFPGLKTVGISEENGTWIAFTVAPETKKDSLKTGKKGKPGQAPGDNLVLFNTITRDTLLVKNVTEYFCPKKGGSVSFIRQQKDTAVTYSAVLRLNTETAQIKEIWSSEGFIKKIVTDEKGENFSFLFSGDTAETRAYALYLGNALRVKPFLVADQATPGMPDGWSPSENGSIYFSRDASRLYFGTAPSPVAEPKDTIPEDEVVRVDVWNWKDLTLQPQQKVELDREKKRSYQAVYHLKEKQFIPLADSSISRITTILKGDGNIALAGDERPFLRARSWTGNYNADYYLVDVKTGARRPIATDKERVMLSPAGGFVIWFEPSDSCFYSCSTDPSKPAAIAITQTIPYPLYDEQNDLPDFPRPYGIAGWSEDDRFVFIYDRFDIWKTDPSGKQPPTCVTKAYGRKNHIQLRYIRTDREEEFIPSGKPALLSAFDTGTMMAGFCQTDLFSEKEPVLLIMDEHRYGMPQKAADADRLLWTRESATEFPDLRTSSLTFENQQRISDANPQQKEYNWLTAELVQWTSFAGDTLKGLLYKPENFDPSVKYPVIVYYYERNAEGLHRYTTPSPSRSAINRSFYCSNGYLVFIPDITYRIGYPGQSAYDAIVSGVYALSATRPWIDISRVGLQGHSWGGYQTAWLITRTTLFAAAMAGAPVSNMTSAYGGIRWESGMSRMFQYEQTQSRIGGTLWEKPMHYIENSPLFAAPEITTPLLMMHNDNDGAVPWYQGIEFFSALRRLDKPVWMLTYNGEPHGLKGESWGNRMDFDKRMFQFFNHYLKGEPMPEWMEKGVPAILKGKKPQN